MVNICVVNVAGLYKNTVPESKMHGANMGPIWGRQDPGGPHVGPLNFAIWGIALRTLFVGICRHLIMIIIQSQSHKSIVNARQSYDI